MATVGGVTGTGRGVEGSVGGVTGPGRGSAVKVGGVDVFLDGMEGRAVPGRTVILGSHSAAAPLTPRRLSRPLLP